MNKIIILFTCYLLLLLYIIEQKKLKKKLESFNINLTDETIRQNIELLLSIAKGENANCSLYITNNLNVGNLTVKNGSEFNGKRHYFQDRFKTGRLRIGAVNGKPGIHAEDGKDLTLDSNSIIFGKIKICDNLNIKNNFITNLH